VINPRPPAAASAAAAAKSTLTARLFQSRAGLVTAALVFFVSVALLLMLAFIGGPDASRRTLQRLSIFARRRKAKEEGSAGAGANFETVKSLVGRAVELTDNAPKPKGYEEKVLLLLQRAGWPMRVSEFLLIRGAAGILGFFAGAVFFRSGWIGILLFAVGVVTPRIVLKYRIEKRSSAFYAALPDTLQIFAGSLEAGYGLMQVIDTVVQESSPPTSTEFSRVLSESRLGMPLDESLERMADRVGGEDFRWVVLAINIQRQVGGNLASLLSNVASTLRERNAVRRQVKVLSAEGRLSAIVLVVLPFLLAAFVSLTNPEYLQELLIRPIGRLLIIGGVAFMAFGAVWIRKIIRVEI
jgi:tight adherence protein B